jgi:hypothetical protein
LPHPPQLAGSVSVFVSQLSALPSQLAKPASQVFTVHTPAAQPG